MTKSKFTIPVGFHEFHKNNINQYKNGSSWPQGLCFNLSSNALHKVNLKTERSVQPPLSSTLYEIVFDFKLD